jgi:hypothetical protein
MIFDLRVLSKYFILDLSLFTGIIIVLVLFNDALSIAYVKQLNSVQVKKVMVFKDRFKSEVNFK